MHSFPAGFFFILFFVLGSLTQCHAQTVVSSPDGAVTLNDYAVQPYGSGLIELLEGLGYKNPNLIGSSGVDIETARLFANANASLGWTRKIETGDGHSHTFAGTACWRLGRLMAGGGASWERETTSQWSKASWSPQADAGYDWENARLLVTYALPWLDAQNAEQGVTVHLELRGSGPWRVAISEGFYRFHDTRVAGVTYAEPAQSHTGGAATFSVKYTFHSPNRGDVWKLMGAARRDSLFFLPRSR